jgi:hypothetical protein
VTSVSIKFYKALEYYNHDTLIKTLTLSSADYKPSSDMDLADLDNDELNEIVAAWINNNQVEIVVLKADPAFILPWRYDPEKGDAISDIKRSQTKDIVFKPEDPVAGEIITIYAQVHNFSLIPTPTPMGVRFYVGDPDNGGTLIVGEGNVTEVFTDGAIPSRGTMQVEMKWKIPEDLSSFPRIYAVIDADKILPEIHENNNKSWNILQKTTGEPSSDATIEDIPGEYILERNFPNPFSQSTRIRFSVPASQHVTIEVYNLYGQKIETLIDKPMIAGSYEVEFFGQNHASGIYFCRIKAGEFQQVMKMALFK